MNQQVKNRPHGFSTHHITSVQRTTITSVMLWEGFLNYFLAGIVSFSAQNSGGQLRNGEQRLSAVESRKTYRTGQDWCSPLCADLERSRKKEPWPLLIDHSDGYLSCHRDVYTLFSSWGVIYTEDRVHMWPRFSASGARGNYRSLQENQLRQYKWFQMRTRLHWTK